MKKGAAKPGSNAAILIFIIGLSLVVYAILEDSIPDGTSFGSTGTNVNTVSKSVYLMRENVGHLAGDKKEFEEYILPSVTLFTKINSNIFLSSPRVDVNSNIFGQDTKALEFSIDNLNIVKNSLVTFTGDSQGLGKTLIVSLNGVEIFNGPTQNNNLVTLNKYALKQGLNKLEFKSESSFFGNKISISNVQVIGDLYDLTKNKASIDFTVFKEDLNDFKSASMNFYVDCLETDIGLLRIIINSNQIYEAIPDCGIVNNNIQVPLYNIKSGNNNLKFENDYGSYVLDQVALRAEYLNPKEPIYYFSIEKDTLIENDFKLNFKFPDREFKDGLVYVNKHPIVLNTDLLNISYDIKDFVSDGFNFVKIIPNEAMDIAEVNVEIVDKDYRTN